MDERDRGQGSLSDRVKGSYRRVSVVMYVTLVIAAIAVFAAAYVPKQFSLAYTILVLIVFLITAVNDTRLIQRNSQKIVDAVCGLAVAFVWVPVLYRPHRKNS